MIVIIVWVALTAVNNVRCEWSRETEDKCIAEWHRLKAIDACQITDGVHGDPTTTEYIQCLHGVPGFNRSIRNYS